MTKLLVGREEADLLSGFSVQLLMSAPVCLLISLTLVPEGPALINQHHPQHQTARVGMPTTENKCRLQTDTALVKLPQHPKSLHLSNSLNTKKARSSNCTRRSHSWLVNVEECLPMTNPAARRVIRTTAPLQGTAHIAGGDF